MGFPFIDYNTYLLINFSLDDLSQDGSVIKSQDMHCTYLPNY